MGKWGLIHFGGGCTMIVGLGLGITWMMILFFIFYFYFYFSLSLSLSLSFSFSLINFASFSNPIICYALSIILVILNLSSTSPCTIGS